MLRQAFDRHGEIFDQTLWTILRDDWARASVAMIGGTVHWERRWSPASKASALNRQVNAARIGSVPTDPAAMDDWSGVAPDRSPIEPLDAHTFFVRLRRLSERAESLTILRGAFERQQSGGEQLPRDSEPASRPSR